MSDFLQCFRARASRILHGAEWNRTRREILQAAEIEPVIFETTVQPGEDWERFRDRVFPLFYKYMDAKGVNPENPKLAIVAIFDGPECLILEGPDFVRCLMEIEGLNDAALHFRILRWLRE